MKFKKTPSLDPFGRVLYQLSYKVNGVYFGAYTYYLKSERPDEQYIKDRLKAKIMDDLLGPMRYPQSTNRYVYESN
jgi:hypothetical protein